MEFPVPESKLTPLEVLQRRWGYSDFRPMQAEIISSVLSGEDTLGLMATGGGKSLTFQVPALLLDGLTVVVTPLISLMKDQVDNLRSHGVRAEFLHSGMTHRQQMLAFDRCRLRKSPLLYLSPEKLQSRNFMDLLPQLPVRLIVVDEAHCISQWGYDFRPSYLHIACLRELFPGAPVLALTASATPRVIEDICRQLHFRKNSSTFRLSFNRSNINYIVRECKVKEDELLRVLRGVAGSAIVYVRSRKRAALIAETLRQAGVTASFYHAGLTVEEKNLRQNQWKTGETRVIVATTAFGMGIDKPDVRVVVHVDPPLSLEEYYQEAGRAGRDGLTSYAVVLINSSVDKGRLMRAISIAFPPKDFVREIYQKLCVFLSVAMGEGYEAIYDFNVENFCRKYSLEPRMAMSALRILEASGYISYIDEGVRRARLMVIMSRRQLYDLKLSGDVESVFSAVLRNYTGIFADYEHISEQDLANILGLTPQTVYEALLQLSRMRVIHYVPRNDNPYILFRQSRIPKDDIVLPKGIYQLRREQMEQRIDAMKSFLFTDEHCRVRTLLEYFGETAASDCSTCDVCRSHRKAITPDTPSRIETEILEWLGSQGASIAMSDLRKLSPHRAEEMIAALRRMVDKEVLEFDFASQSFRRCSAK